MSTHDDVVEVGVGGEQAAASKAFDLEKQKALALQELPPRGRESPAFKQFYKSKLCDDFLCAALDHVAALLRVDDMAMARTAGKKHQDILPPSQEEKNAASLLDQTVKEVSTYYCYTIMQFSRYQAAQQDRMFFESLYEFITGIVVAAFPSQHRFRIEDEIGRIVRSDTFNMTRRKNDSNHHTKMNFSSRELYVLRYAGDGFMGKRILSALHPRRHAGDSVNQAVARRSPLAAKLVPSAKEISEKNVAQMRELAASRAKSRSPGKMRPVIEKSGAFSRMQSGDSHSTVTPERLRTSPRGRSQTRGGGAKGHSKSPRGRKRSESALGGYAGGLPQMGAKYLGVGGDSPKKPGHWLHEKPASDGPKRPVGFKTTLE